MVDGELVVCGRIKDVIIVGGRNVFPEDVERAVGDDRRRARRQRHRVRRATGRGKEGVVSWPRPQLDDVAATAPDRRRTGPPSVGLPAAATSCWSQPGTLPKTSSGKLQRSLCRQRYLGERARLV